MQIKCTGTEYGFYGMSIVNYTQYKQNVYQVCASVYKQTVHSHVRALACYT